MSSAVVAGHYEIFNALQNKSEQNSENTKRLLRADFPHSACSHDVYHHRKQQTMLCRHGTYSLNGQFDRPAKSVMSMRSQSLTDLFFVTLYLTVILQTRVVYELIADEVRSTELAIRHIRRE